MICKECSFEQDLSLAFDQTEEACDRCKAVGEWKEDEAKVVVESELLLPVVYTKMDPAAVFTTANIDTAIAKLNAKAKAFTADTSTAKGRKAARSFSAKFSSTKVALDTKGAELVAGWKAQAKTIDVERKRFRDTCDELRDSTKQPVIEWEAVEKERVAAEELALEIETAHGEAIAENDLFNRQKEVEQKEQAMEMAEAARVAKELAAKEEVERLATEAKEKEELAARNEKIRAEAEKKAKDEAAQKIADAKAEIEQAKLEKIEAAKKAEEDKAAAVVEAKRQAAADAKDLAEKAELERLAKETEDRLALEAAEKKAANKKHMAKVKLEARSSIVGLLGITLAQADGIFDAIDSGKVPHVSVKY